MANWKIEQLMVKPVDGDYTNVVVTAAWRCSATSGDYSASNYGSVSFSAPGDNFIPYANLTEQEVLGWVWASGVDKDAVEANVTKELDALVNPPVVAKPLPWNSQSVETVSAAA